MLKKSDVCVGAIVEVIKDGNHGYTNTFWLNAMKALTDPTSQYILSKGTKLTVLSKPRKIDGINVVQISIVGEQITGYVYYCDLVGRCKLVNDNVERGNI